MNTNQRFDFVIIGGGLAGSLFLAALKQYHPQLTVLLVETETHLGGNHTWSLHDSDIPPAARTWFEPLISKSWPGYDVLFPQHSRFLESTYHSLRSSDLHDKLSAQLSKHLRLGHSVQRLKPTAEGETDIELNSGETLRAHSLILARGWKPVLNPKSYGWQKFVGLEVRLKSPHSLLHPILKDARVPQIDGYRFVYTLPFSETDLLIEDTYYSNHPGLKIERIEKEIHQYAERQGWIIDQVLRREVGVLPLAMRAPQLKVGDWPSLGAESEFLNPVTGYTLPMTLRLIQALMEHSSLTMSSMKRALRDEFRREHQRMKYFAMLNRMMFLAAKNEQRYKILERFYRLPEGLIDRFYSGQLNRWDQIRILMGKPPVPIGQAMKAIYGGPPR